MRVKNTLLCLVATLLVQLAVSLIDGTHGWNEAVGKSISVAEYVEQVSMDSLETMVLFLTTDPATSEPRSRFVLREQELARVADSLSARLERYIGNPVDRVQFTFEEYYYSGDSTFTSENIVGRLKGTIGDSAPVVLVTAHYDAIGYRTEIGGEQWRDNWETWPAPGADDNGTGVAALMEAARVLADCQLPFDILFVLFSAEELGKLGSEDFVERYDDLYGEEILAVLNIDMIGYLAIGKPAGTIISDYRSGWLSDLVYETSGDIDPQLPMRIINPGQKNYDHGPFWDRHIPAVTLCEPLEGISTILYPYYHTVEDIIDWIDFEQAYRITKVLVGFLAGFSTPYPEIALFPSDLLLMRNENVTGKRVFEVGDSIDVWVRVWNIGGATLPAGSEVQLTVKLENNYGVSELLSEELGYPGTLEAQEVKIPLLLTESFAGGNRISASVSVQGFEDYPGNNETEVSFGVEGGDEMLLLHSFRPNPIRTSFAESFFCVNLTGEVNLILEIYTLEGECVGTAKVGSAWGNPLSAGLNYIKCGKLFPGITRLVSGVYIYRIKLYDVNNRDRSYTGRFAVEN